MSDPDEKPRCKNCKFWTDYSDRVFARVAGTTTNMARNLLELRRCAYEPPPSVAVQSASVYTDGEYSCCAHVTAQPSS